MSNIHDITLAEAAEMTKSYRDQSPGEKLGGKFNKAAIQSILDQPECKELRYYYALNAGVKTIVLVGVDSAGNDLYNGKLAEYAQQDPPYQSTPNPLNS